MNIVGKFILTTLIPLLFLGCDSPIRNKVKAEGVNSKSSGKTMSFSAFGLKAEVRWLKGPFGSAKRDNHLLVFILNDKGDLQALPKGTSLDFYSTMPSMGHPMDEAGFFEEIATGIYLNKNIRFNMPGDWQNELWIMDDKDNIKGQLKWLMFF